MFTSRSVLISLVAAAACFAMPAQSADGVFTAAMDGAQCLPDAIQTPATGTVELRVSADGKKIDYKITLNKLSNPSQADLHTPSPLPHSFCGSVPATKGVHLPARPVWLHATQVPRHAVSQHTPSTQKLDAHVLPEVQV